MSTHNLCFRAKIRKNEYPCKPQFYYIKVGCKGVFTTWTCCPDDGSLWRLVALIVIGFNMCARSGLLSFL